MADARSAYVRWLGRLGLVGAVGFVALGVAAQAAGADYSRATVERVTSIYDGDTFRADIAGWPPIIGERVPIRLRGARETRLDHIDRGKYFRLVAGVMVDGRDLSDMLIGAGLARPYEGGHRRGWCD